MPKHGLALASEYNDQGEALRKSGQHAKALPWYEKAISIAEKEVGEDDLFVSGVLNNLVLSLIATGKIAPALKHLDRILRIQRTKLPPNDPMHADTLNRFAYIFEQAGQYDEAIQVTEKALKLDRDSLGNHHEKVGNDLSNLGGLHLARGDFKKAAAYFKDALEISAINNERGQRIQFLQFVIKTIENGNQEKLEQLRKVFTTRA